MLRRTALPLVPAFMLAFVVVAGVLASSTAEAQDRPLMVVPFDQSDISQDTYDRFMKQLNSDAEASDLYQVIPDVDQTMSELLLVVGCTEASTDCLKLIGETFGAEVILWGELAGSGDTVLQNVNMYDVFNDVGLLDVPIENTYESADPEIMHRYLIGEIQQVFFPFTGKLSITTSEPDAEILFDGAPVGNTSDGALALDQRALGEHSITAKIGEREVTVNAIVVHGEVTEVFVDMAQPEVGGPSGHLTSYILGGVGLVSLAVGGGLSFLVSQATTETEDLAAKNVFGPGDADTADGLRSDGPTLQNLQFISYGVGTAFIGAAAIVYFLFETDAESAAPAQARPLFLPVLGPDHVGVNAGFSY